MNVRKTALCAMFVTAIVSPLARGQTADPPATRPATSSWPLTKTVGVDIIKKTVNPDGSFTLLFQWPDKEKNLLTRSVIVNSGTVIGIDGQLKTMADITDAVLKKKAVATCGPDMVTAVNLRFGRAMIVVSADELTPAQIAALRAAAPATNPASDATLEKRVDKIVASLNLNDPAKEARLKAVLSTDLLAVRDSHNAGFAPEKSIHANLNMGLQAELTPEQIETVKDELTVRKVPVTFNAYHQIVPNLTAAEDAKILDLLRQAREKCLDLKNPDEMARVFEPYKKQIETFLIADGHDWKTLYKQFVDAQKAKQPPPATKPAA